MGERSGTAVPLQARAVPLQARAVPTYWNGGLVLAGDGTAVPASGISGSNFFFSSFS